MIKKILLAVMMSVFAASSFAANVCQQGTVVGGTLVTSANGSGLKFSTNTIYAEVNLGYIGTPKITVTFNGITAPNGVQVSNPTAYVRYLGWGSQASTVMFNNEPPGTKTITLLNTSTAISSKIVASATFDVPNQAASLNGSYVANFTVSCAL